MARIECLAKKIKKPPYRIKGNDPNWSDYDKGDNSYSRPKTGHRERSEFHRNQRQNRKPK